MTQLSKKISDHIDLWIQRYPEGQKRSGIFEALRITQEENGGYLTSELIQAVADYLEIPHTNAFEVATFYTHYRLSPVGKHLIEVCTNISCTLNGAEKLLGHLENKLNIKLNETTTDGNFTLKEVECLGACIAAPVCQIGKQYYEKLTPQKIDQVLSQLTGADHLPDGLKSDE